MTPWAVNFRDTFCRTISIHVADTGVCRLTFNSAGVLRGGSVGAPKFLPRQARLSRPVPDVSGPGRPQPPGPWERGSGRTRPEGGGPGRGVLGFARVPADAADRGSRTRPGPPPGPRSTGAPRAPTALSARASPAPSAGGGAPARPRGEQLPGGPPPAAPHSLRPAGRPRTREPAPRSSVPRRRFRRSSSSSSASRRGAAAAVATVRPRAPAAPHSAPLLPAHARCRPQMPPPAPTSPALALPPGSGEGGPRPPKHAQRRRPGRGGGGESPATEAREGQDTARPDTACDRGELGTPAVGVRHPPSTGRPPALPLTTQDLLRDAFLPEESVCLRRLLDVWQ